MNIISRTMNMKYSLCLRVFYTLKYSRRVSLEVFDFKPGARADRSGSHAVPRKSGEETVAAFTTKTRRRKGTQDSPGFFVPSRLRGERQASDYSALSLEE